jgi:hypothetical protein
VVYQCHFPRACLCMQYDGATLAAAHEHLIREKGLNLTHFDAVSGWNGVSVCVWQTWLGQLGKGLCDRGVRRV